MWQVTWALSLLPAWVWPALLFTGIGAVLAAWVLSFIPFVKNYKLPLQVGGIIAVVISVWFLGAASNDAKWQNEIAELQKRVAAAETKSTEATVVVQEKVVTKTKVIREQAKTQIEYIDRVVTQDKEVIKYIEQCPVPKVIIDQHNLATELNRAAEGKK